MELIKVYENYYTFYKVVTERKGTSIELLVFDIENLVARISVSTPEATIFHFETTSDFCYNNKKYFEKDLEQAIKIVC